MPEDARVDLATPQRRALLALLAAWPLAGAAQPGVLAALRELERAARAEGRLVSVGMPDDWANWRGIWADLKKLYGVDHVDEDMTSAEEIARMANDGINGKVDIGDVGFEYVAIARGRGVTLPHKPAVWDQIPDWAKDGDGFWALAYTGTSAFAVNKRRVDGRVPQSWRELFAGRYAVQVGEVGSSSQANAAVLAAAFAHGGSETRLQPALAQFARLRREDRLMTANPSIARMERAEADVFLLWDFHALALRERLANAADYEVLIPSDGATTSGYSPIINRHAPHPNAAMLAHEYIFSDAGQIQLARGHARPIRLRHLQLPDGVQRQMIPAEQYRAARTVQPAVWAWEVKKLAKAWAELTVPPRP